MVIGASRPDWPLTAIAMMPTFGNFKLIISPRGPGVTLLETTKKSDVRTNVGHGELTVRRHLVLPPHLGKSPVHTF